MHLVPLVNARYLILQISNHHILQHLQRVSIAPLTHKAAPSVGLLQLNIYISCIKWFVQ